MASVEKSSDGGQPHAFVFPYPVQGHIQPFMRLSKLLATNYGFLISFFNSEENHRRLTASSSHNEPPSPQDADADDKPHDMRMLFLPDRPPSPLEMQEFSGSHIEMSHVLLSKTFLNTDPAALEALIRSQNPRITCLIFDWMVPAITPHLAENLGLPVFIFFTASAASLAMTIRSGEVGGDVKQMTRIAGAPDLEVSEVNPFLSMCGRGASDYMCRLFTKAFKEKLVKERDVILVNTAEEIEGRTVEYLKEQGRRVCAIGPLLPAGGSIWAEEKSCLEWLDRQPEASVLFVSFGSLAPLSSTQFLELALGLEASNHHILWVTRPDLIYGKAPSLPSDFLDRIKERILIVSWAPQLLVLGHSSIGGFLSHCGWNSTLESLASGIPILAWPFFGDQMMNAKFVVHSWRIGLSLAQRDGLITKAHIENRIRDLMAREIGKELRERAQGLKHRVRSSLSKGVSSFNNLHNLFGHSSSPNV